MSKTKDNRLSNVFGAAVATGETVSTDAPDRMAVETAVVDVVALLQTFAIAAWADAALV